MIKNIKLKNFLSNTVFAALSVLNKVVPKNDKIILLYANCEFRDNLDYLYQYLIEHKYNKKYHIIRSYRGICTKTVPDNVDDVSNIRAIIEYLRAGHVYYAFGKLPIFPSDKQVVIQMWHGAPFKGMDKGVRTSRKNKAYYTYYLTHSDYFRKAVHEAYACDDNHIAICGEPRTDVMFEENDRYELSVAGKKIIIWMPTFRKSKYVGYSDVNQQRSIVPFFTNEELVQLNHKLRDMDIGLIVKIHPAQDLDLFKNLALSNICILSHEMFVSRGYDLYRLLAQTDALITDYSSVFYDYMILDRPIAFTMEDFEEYKKNRGFIMQDPETLMAGHKIHSQDDFILFVRDVSEGKDPWKEKRNEVNVLVNEYRDGQNRRRALEISNITVP